LTKDRIELYRKKGAIVVFHCATKDGMCHSFYLKDLGNGKYCLMRENIFDNEEVKVQGPWEAPTVIKASLLIQIISNNLKLRTISMKRIYIQPIKDYNPKLEAKIAK